MQKFILRAWLLCCLGALSIKLAQAQEARSILGLWKDSAHPEKKVEMFEQNDRFFGRSTQREPKAGFIVFQDLIWNAGSKSYQGALNDPAGSGRYPITITWDGPNTFQFKVKKLVFTRSFRFVRITQ